MGETGHVAGAPAGPPTALSASGRIGTGQSQVCNNRELVGRGGWRELPAGWAHPWGLTPAFGGGPKEGRSSGSRPVFDSPKIQALS